MEQIITAEIPETLARYPSLPSVSIVLPFEPKMSSKAELGMRLKNAVEKADAELCQRYHSDLSVLVIQKLREIIKNLNYSTYKKSIAIFVSPVFEKVLYLDIPMEERVTIDGSFEIKNLLYAKKEIQQYLVMVLSAKNSKVYLGNYSRFIKVKSNVPDHIAAFRHHQPEPVANFSDASHNKEVLIKKFLAHTDDGLRFLLHAYPVPVFVMGAKKILGYFKSLTKNSKNIAGYITGNYESSTDAELSDILKPSLDNWKKVKLDDLHHQMELAADSGKLATGMNDVWEKAAEHKGKLLIIEKNFTHQLQKNALVTFNKFSYIKDAVDGVIEKVLENGGDVEFVEEGMLNDYQHISLIQYY